MKENSIRLRLTQSEVKNLFDRGEVTEMINFGADFGGELTYVLRVDPDARSISANVGSRIITVVLPASVAESWIGTDQIGVEAVQTVGSDKELQVVIEKDFACLSPRPGEDQSDNFPNPNKGSVC